MNFLKKVFLKTAGTAGTAGIALALVAGIAGSTAPAAFAQSEPLILPPDLVAPPIAPSSPLIPTLPPSTDSAAGTTLAPLPAPAPAPVAPAAPTPADLAKRFLFEAQLPAKDSHGEALPAEATFNRANYTAAVNALFDAFEQRTGRVLKPEREKRVGLKIYTASGAGIATPKNLVRAVVAALVKRGFKHEGIYLVDLHEKTLRESGYLPPLRTAGEGFKVGNTRGADGKLVPVLVPVLALDADNGKFFSARHFYDNPLPSREIFARQGDFDAALALEDRKSFLPVPLLYQMDFWLNLPVALDSGALGVSGALGNATIWNISNQKRFLDNSENAQKAAVEIAASPEFQSTLVFHLLTLERYQYVGGPLFDSNYCVSEPRLWLSGNPLILDHLLLQRINHARDRRGFPKIEPEPRMFVSGNTPPINLGSCRPAEITLVQIGTGNTAGNSAAAGASVK